MSRVYSAFSNPGGDLKQLQKEFATLFNLFNDPGIKKKVDFAFALNESVAEMTSDIVKDQGQIRLFHFSGHSGGSGLDFHGTDFDTEHVSRFFNTIGADRSRIECVLLNGCENAEIVQKLSAVPVVIGTRTPIRDSAAQKFTHDFFAALMSAGSTYKQAFHDAVAAQKDLKASVTERVRGEGSTEDAPPQLDDYFLVINDSRVAGKGFPFKRAPHNWTKYLLVFFLIVAGALAWLFREKIALVINDFTCIPIRTEAGKCNFVITEFSGDRSFANFEDLLHRKISRSPVLQSYLHAINLGSFDRVIRGSKVQPDNLPKLCKYDFNLSGILKKSGETYEAEFDIYPLNESIKPFRPFVYSVETINQLDTLNAKLDTSQADQFVLFQMCAVCALQKGGKELKSVMKELLADYAVTPATATSYQQMQFRMAEVALSTSDTVMALEAYDAIAKAAPNDFALSAHEQKIRLMQISGNITGLYNAQVQYREALEVRKNRPSQYQLSKPPQEYDKASERVRLQHAELGKEYKDTELRHQRAEVIKDYEHLDRVKYNNKTYSDEIRVLRNDAAVAPVSPAVTHGALTNPSSFMLQPHISTLHFTQPQVPVLLAGFGVTIIDLRKLIGRLEEAGYVTDAQQTKILQHWPATMTAESQVIYHKPDHQEFALKLANTLSEWTGSRFQVKRAENLAIHSLQAAEDVRIYWRK